MKILLAPLDPVHDAGVKFIKRKLDTLGYECVLLPPDITVEEIGDNAKKEKVDIIFISRTVGYGVEQLFRRVHQSLTQSGLMDKTRVAIGGMAITPDLAKSLGFEAGFGQDTRIEEILAFIERNPELAEEVKRPKKNKPEFPTGHDYMIRDKDALELLDQIVDNILDWSKRKISPGIRRARITEKQLKDVKGSVEDYTALPFTKEYLSQCGQSVKDFFQRGIHPPNVRQIKQKEIDRFRKIIQQSKKNFSPKFLQHGKTKPLVFTQYGTGCPMMDAMHIKVCEGWGADGVLHFDPAWGARTEGLMDGYLTNAEDGTPVTYANLSLIKSGLHESTLWSVRSHRGLNTPEITVLAGFLGADLTKINIPYGSLAGGTDPARLTVDGVEAVRLAARYKMPFDIPTNEELAGVPVHKAFASMLIMAWLGVRLRAKPILKPLICHGPYILINEFMEQNYVDYNYAKIQALRNLCDIPIWAGEPIGFMTHTEEKMQSATATALHVAICSSLELDAVTTASTDEAFSRGPITASARVGSLKAIKETFRSLGSTQIEPTKEADNRTEEIVTEIKKTLKSVASSPSFVDALYQGLLGSKEDGAYPGRAGRDSIQEVTD